MILPKEFYFQEDVVTLAKQLLGKHLFTQIDGELTGGIITETEAYKGPEDKACHAYNNRRTARTEVMFHDGGIAYVYLCYGMHHLFNIVTNRSDTPHAILVRALLPTHGIPTMEKRRKTKKNLTSGPGTLCQALCIDRSFNGYPLSRAPIWVEDQRVELSEIKASPRIGVDYAEEHAQLPWRFNALLLR